MSGRWWCLVRGREQLKTSPPSCGRERWGTWSLQRGDGREGAELIPAGQILLRGVGTPSPRAWHGAAGRWVWGWAQGGSAGRGCYVTPCLWKPLVPEWVKPQELLAHNSLTKLQGLQCLSQRLLLAHSNVASSNAVIMGGIFRPSSWSSFWSCSPGFGT